MASVAPRPLRVSPRLRAAALLVAVGLCLSACAGGGDGEPAAGAPAKAVRKPSAGNAAAQMVAAVPSTGAASLIEMRFELGGRPVAGQPLEVSVALVPSVPTLRSFSVIFQSSDAVEVRSGAQLALDEPPMAGTAYFHTVSVVPRRDGVSYLSAVVLVDQEGMSVARSFAIPLIVGDSFAASAGAP
jgi:hypothetical protein